MVSESGCIGLYLENTQAKRYSIDTWVGGSFSFSGVNASAGICRLRDNKWLKEYGTLAGDGVSYSITHDSNYLYVGGSFHYAGYPYIDSFDEGIARYDLNTLEASPLGSGFSGQCYALASDGSNLYAGGAFYNAGSTIARFVAKWDGSSWNNLGSGIGSWCYSLATDNNNNLYVGGSFSSVDYTNIPANHVAKWNGSSWSAMGSGIEGSCYCLAADKYNNIYAGDNEYVYKWDGEYWHKIASGITGQCNALVIDSKDNLYVGGTFEAIGGQSISRVGKFNGTQWEEVGGGLGGQCTDLAIDDNDNLYAVGTFSSAGSSTAKYAAKFNGEEWSALADDSLNSFSYAVDSVTMSENYYYQESGNTINIYEVGGGTLKDGNILDFNYGISQNSQYKYGTNFSGTITSAEFYRIYDGQYAKVSGEKVYGTSSYSNGEYHIDFYADSGRLYKTLEYSSASPNGTDILASGIMYGNDLYCKFSYEF